MRDDSRRHQRESIQDGIRTLIRLGELDHAQSVIDEYEQMAGVLDPEIYVLEAEISSSRGNAIAAFRRLELGLIADSSHAALWHALGDLYFSAGHETFQRLCFEDAAFCYARAFLGCSEAQKKEVVDNLKTIEGYRQNAALADSHSSETPLPSLTHGEGFVEELVRRVLAHEHQFHPYNIDLEYAEWIKLPPLEIAMVNPALQRTQLIENLTGIERLHGLLCDESSQELLVMLIAYRILGNWKVKLPTDTPEYWIKRCTAKALAKPESLYLDSINAQLPLLNLEEVGFRMRLYSAPHQVCATFLLGQYEYGEVVRPEEGDIVLDCGGCWGDTALYFAQLVGPKGQVHSFEFIPSNLDVFRLNVGLNPHLEGSIKVAERPLWDVSGLELRYLDKGPASKVTFDQNEPGDTTETISIDDYVKQAGLERVDFIKMDIEGAELRALKGAVESLKSHRPKLAITVYHQVSDFGDIASFLADLDLGYSFHLGHFTTYFGETVLFAAPENPV